MTVVKWASRAVSIIFLGAVISLGNVITWISEPSFLIAHLLAFGIGLTGFVLVFLVFKATKSLGRKTNWLEEFTLS
jgi:hypothetical protein